MSQLFERAIRTLGKRFYLQTPTQKLTGQAIILLASVSKALGHCTVTLFVLYLFAQKEGIKSSG